VLRHVIEQLEVMDVHGRGTEMLAGIRIQATSVPVRPPRIAQVIGQLFPWAFYLTGRIDR